MIIFLQKKMELQKLADMVIEEFGTELFFRFAGIFMVVMGIMILILNLKDRKVIRAQNVMAALCLIIGLLAMQITKS